MEKKEKEKKVKTNKLELLLMLIAFLVGCFFVVGCSNPQCENFTVQILEREHIVEAIISMKAKDPDKPMKNELTEIELRWILQSGYEGLGLTEKEAKTKVDELLKGDKKCQTK